MPLILNVAKVNNGDSGQKPRKIGGGVIFRQGTPLHSYNKVGELFMRTLWGHKYDYDFFSFCTLTEYLQNFIDIFSLVFLIVETYFVFFRINFVSTKAYATVVSNNYKKIMKFTLTVLIKVVK